MIEEVYQHIEKLKKNTENNTYVVLADVDGYESILAITKDFEKAYGASMTYIYAYGFLCVGYPIISQEGGMLLGYSGDTYNTKDPENYVKILVYKED